MSRFSYDDRINILSKITITRAINAVKIFSSYYAAKIFKVPVQWGKPLAISIEPTTSCNLRCPECPSGLRSFTRPTGMLQQQLFYNLLHESEKHLVYLTFYFQGEPYLHPQFLQMVKEASLKNIYTATSTNAHYLNDEQSKKTVESGLDRLIISIDGTTQEVYEQYRKGGDLNKVIEGTKNILKWKKILNSKTPQVVFQFLVVKPNEHQLTSVVELGESIGVDDIWFKTAQVYDFENGNELIPDNKNFSRYKKHKDGHYSIKNRLLNHCWKMWHSCVITWDGKVVPCCFDKDAQHQLGDLNQQSLSTIWKSEKYRNFRSAVLRSRKEIDICANCSEGSKVWA